MCCSFFNVKRIYKQFLEKTAFLCRLKFVGRRYRNLRLGSKGQHNNSQIQLKGRGILPYFLTAVDFSSGTVIVNPWLQSLASLFSLFFLFALEILHQQTAVDINAWKIRPSPHFVPEKKLFMLFVGLWDTSFLSLQIIGVVSFYSRFELQCPGIHRSAREWPIYTALLWWP